MDKTTALKKQQNQTARIIIFKSHAYLQNMTCKVLNDQYKTYADSEVEVSGPPPPWKIIKQKENYKATKSLFNVWPSSYRQRRYAGEPTMARFW